MAPVFMIFLFHLWILLIRLPATLSMQFAAEIPENVTSFEGDTVILRCVVVDKDEDNPVYWQRYDGSSTRLGTISRDRDTEPYAHFYPDFSPRLEVVGDESLGEYHLLISNLSLRMRGGTCVSFAIIEGTARTHPSPIFASYRVSSWG